MYNPMLTNEEREAINADRWFKSLSPSLRHDILRYAKVKRFRDGEQIATRSETGKEWIACARGAVRISSTSPAGKQVTLIYVEPGVWFGAMAMFDDNKRSHDSHAHGECTVICVSQADFRKILAQHVELYEALLRLQARRRRHLYRRVEDLSNLSLRTRLAAQLIRLARSFGKPDPSNAQEMRIGLKLLQQELAQLLGASRQRVNLELKSMEREESIRIESGSLIVRNEDALLRIVEAAH